MGENGGSKNSTWQILAVFKIQVIFWGAVNLALGDIQKMEVEFAYFNTQSPPTQKKLTAVA